MAEEKRGRRDCPADFYTLREVGRELGVPRSTMDDCIANGNFKNLLPDIAHLIIRVGNSYLINKNTFDKYLKQGVFWTNTNKNGTAGRPVRWVKDTWKWVRFKFPNSLRAKFKYLVKNANEQSPGNHISLNDAHLLAIEEFIDRRPELMEGFKNEE